MGEATAIRERPILFSGEMVRAILDGKKSQTRRVIRALPSRGYLIHNDPGGVGIFDDTGEHKGAAIGQFWYLSAGGKPIARLTVYEIPGNPRGIPHVPGQNNGKEWSFNCPYGIPGDRIWVRESCWLRPERSERDMREGADTWPKVVYRADGEPNGAGWCKENNWKATSSIHMPRWASRITLEITNVRVERLQEITRKDALAEGVQYTPNICGGAYLPCEGDGFADSAQDAFAFLWDKINAKRGYPWESNPWVWVIEFKRAT